MDEWGETKEPLMEMPKGFSHTPLSDGCAVILYTRTGMGCMYLVLGVCVTIWTFGCVRVFYQFFTGGTMPDGGGIPSGHVAIWGAVEILVVWFFVYSVFAKVSYRLEADNLRWETVLFGLRSSRTVIIPRSSILCVVQVQDGGREKGSSSSWGLQVEAEKTTKVLSRQPHASSYWLGQTLAVWAGVEYNACDEKS